MSYRQKWLLLHFAASEKVLVNYRVDKNDLSIFSVTGEETHEVHPAAMKVTMRYHIQMLCGSLHCVDSLLFYLNSPTRSDGTMLLWDINADGEVCEFMFPSPCSPLPAPLSLLFYLNSPTRSDGTMLLWDINGDGEVRGSSGHFSLLPSLPSLSTPSISDLFNLTKGS